MRIGAGYQLVLTAALVLLPPSCSSAGDDDGGGGEAGQENRCANDEDCAMGCSSKHQICEGDECVDGCRKDADCNMNEHCAKKCSSGCSNVCTGTCKAGARMGKEPPCKC